MREQVGYLLSESGAEENLIFAEYLSALLGKPLSIQRSPEVLNEIDRSWFANTTNDWELALIQVPRPHPKQRGQKDDPTLKLCNILPTSTMFLFKPRWPFRRILLILHGKPVDKASVDWTLRFVQTSRASVTILPLVAPAPNFLCISDFPNLILESLINSNTSLGVLLRRTLATLSWAHIPHNVLLKRGTPEGQIAQVLDQGNHDILIIGDDRRNKLERWVEGNLLSALLRNLDFPVLVAKTLQLNGAATNA